MRGFWPQLAMTVRLHFRNRMALIYSYIFPTIFLIAFWVLYRYDRVPLVRHLGELLTVTILGGACFGLPTTMVSERERGVWRRYRLAPVSTATLVGSTMIARYGLLVLAGLLQIVLAMLLGMPLPRHPVELWLTFTCVAFAFLGLGLVIATMADNVPAVQALGQCIFLPMLIIGGVAVPLASLPDWAQHLSAFFPGRYAVDALQSSVVGTGIVAARFSVFALIGIGAAACVAGSKLFRWDAQQRFATRGGQAWIAVALLAWLAVGLAAEWRGRVLTTAPDTTQATATPAGSPTSAVTPQTASAEPPAPRSAAVDTAHVPLATKKPATTPANTPAPAPVANPNAPPASTPPAATAPTTPAPTTPTSPPSTPPDVSGPSRWQDVTMADIDRELDFSRLPGDGGVVTPIAFSDDVPEQDVLPDLQGIQTALTTWAPGKVTDPVQRVRNLLYVAAVPDLFQMPMERFVPQIVFEQVEQSVPKADLIKVLYWIALHPYEGADAAIDQMQPLGLRNGPSDVEELRNRTAIYAVKLLGRVTGKRPAK
jgi:hypothetical protein